MVEFARQKITIFRVPSSTLSLTYSNNHKLTQLALPLDPNTTCMHYLCEALINYDAMQFDEQKDQVAVEQILRVIFVDPERPNPVRLIDQPLCVFIFSLASFQFNIYILSFVYVHIYKAMEKLKRQLAEAEAALEARKKPPEETGPRIVGEGLVIDEWVLIINVQMI